MTAFVLGLIVGIIAGLCLWWMIFED